MDYYFSQGNGHERDFMDDTNVYIMDAYNRSIYPHDGFAKSKYMAYFNAPVASAMPPRPWPAGGIECSGCPYVRTSVDKIFV